MYSNVKMRYLLIKKGKANLLSFDLLINTELKRTKNELNL